MMIKDFNKSDNDVYMYFVCIVLDLNKNLLKQKPILIHE